MIFILHFIGTKQYPVSPYLNKQVTQILQWTPCPLWVAKLLRSSSYLIHWFLPWSNQVTQILLSTHCTPLPHVCVFVCLCFVSCFVSLSMSYVRMYVHILVYMCMYVYVCRCMHVYVHECMFVCMYVCFCVHAYMHLWVYVHVFIVWVYVRICLYMNMCMCV